MKSIDEAEAQERLDEILDEAQRQPIMIRRQAKESAVVLSLVQFERLRADNIRAFLELRNDVAREANEAGLTEARLIRLLNEN
jgi:PHD/YefM family antitoxin component YafN of YafNO toxin-antitoxin module